MKLTDSFDRAKWSKLSHATVIVRLIILTFVLALLFTASISGGTLLVRGVVSTSASIFQRPEALVLVFFLGLLVPCVVLGYVFIKRPEIWDNQYQLIGIGCGQISVYLVASLANCLLNAPCRVAPAGEITVFFLVAGVLCLIVSAAKIASQQK
ncbi:MAG: hypothetical protein ING66_09050 [Rhodocyclaceae bacterium]|nr:hypothetical protein [Rhodocyclaceae bacterium]MCA3060384.1 hypothetical protein [Rhodocyclaceae bacterium]MCA3084610.1 hypothetical protein [Rhodocyclaceae bacterium]